MKIGKINEKKLTKSAKSGTGTCLSHFLLLYFRLSRICLRHDIERLIKSDNYKIL